MLPKSAPYAALLGLAQPGLFQLSLTESRSSRAKMYQNSRCARFVTEVVVVRVEAAVDAPIEADIGIGAFAHLLPRELLAHAS